MAITTVLHYCAACDYVFRTYMRLILLSVWLSGTLCVFILFQTYDYKRIYDNMLKPAFIFDSRLILDHKALTDIGFHVDAVGKCLARSKSTKAIGN